MDVAPGWALEEEAKIMVRRSKLSRLALPLALVLGLSLAAPALADSVAAEQARGAQVLSQVQHATLSPKSLTSDQPSGRCDTLQGYSRRSENHVRDRQLPSSGNDL